MRHVILLCFSLCSLMTACITTPTQPVPVASEPLRGDEKRIQGAWVVIHNEMSHISTPELEGGIHIFFGRQFRLDTDTGSEAFRIDEESDPKRVDFDDGHSSLIQGIYKLEEGRLTVGTGAPGRSRPTTFKKRFGDRSVLTILRRAPSK